MGSKKYTADCIPSLGNTRDQTGPLRFLIPRGLMFDLARRMNGTKITPHGHVAGTTRAFNFAAYRRIAGIRDLGLGLVDWIFPEYIPHIGQLTDWEEAPRNEGRKRTVRRHREEWNLHVRK